MLVNIPAAEYPYDSVAEASEVVAPACAAMLLLSRVTPVTRPNTSTSNRATPANTSLTTDTVLSARHAHARPATIDSDLF